MLRLGVKIFLNVFACVAVSTAVCAQVEQSVASPEAAGVKFSDARSWDALVAQAKQENKYILVSIFHHPNNTYIMRMDREVYSDSEVGEFLSKHFVAKRLDVSRLKPGSEEGPSWYHDAEVLKKNYLTMREDEMLLFFEPNGRVVHKTRLFLQGKDFSRKKNFLGLVHDAMDPARQYYTQLERFNKTKSGPEQSADELREFCLAAWCYREREWADWLVEEYLNRVSMSSLRKEDFKFFGGLTKIPKAQALAFAYIDKLDNQEILKEENLQMLGDFWAQWVGDSQLAGSDHRFFKLLAANTAIVDKVRSSDWIVETIIDPTIRAEEIYKHIYEDGSPVIAEHDWVVMEASIKSKYPQTDAAAMILDEQIQFYRKSRNGVEAVRHFVRKVDKIGPIALGADADGEIAQIMIPYCDDPAILKKAIKWMDKIIRNWELPQEDFDGYYAGLLYKAGRTDQAITRLQNSKFANKQKWSRILDRMKKGEKIDATWDPDEFSMLELSPKWR